MQCHGVLHNHIREAVDNCGYFGHKRKKIKYWP